MALLVSACGPRSTTRWRAHAPTGKGDLGVLIEGASSSDVDALLHDFPQAQARPLDARAGLYEVFGLPRATVQARTQLVATNNTYYSWPKLAATAVINPLADISASSRTAPAGLRLPGLNTCKAGPPLSDAKLAVSFDSGAAKSSPLTEAVTVELGDRLHARGAAAESKHVLLVTPPPASLVGEQMVTSAVLDYQPDALGLHHVFLVQQDANDVCSIDSQAVVVTANRPFVTPSALTTPLDLAPFTHLDLIHAREAWSRSKGAEIRVAVIDTGSNYMHPALAGSTVHDDGEPGVGIDLVNGDAFAYDDDGHGSHVHGLLAAQGFGLAQEAKVIPIKALSSLGGDAGSIAAGIRYAVDHGAKIINLSLGAVAAEAHPALVSAVTYAEEHDVLLVAAAGNGDVATGLGYSIDDVPTYPASLPNANILTVAAFDRDDALSVYSNFGARSVDVVAPGGSRPSELMRSAAYENPKHELYAGMMGTSMATPVVSGIVAQAWAVAPGLSSSVIKQILLTTGPEIAELKGVTVSGRHVDAAAAVENAYSRTVLF